jgi:hypothetical protein
VNAVSVGSVPFSRKQRKTAKNSGRLAVFCWLKPPTIKDFCGERDPARCKFPAKTAKNSETGK